jgi:hypothetical protein
MNQCNKCHKRIDVWWHNKRAKMDFCDGCYEEFIARCPKLEYEWYLDKCKPYKYTACCEEHE